ncbi:MAG: sulfatase-like hydrolase/transferase [Polyangiaceae bacterium]
MTRRARVALAAALFSLQFVLLDLYFRGGEFYRHTPRALLNAVASAALWYVVWTFRERRAARVAIAVLSAVLLGSDWLFFRYYHAAIDLQVVASALHTWTDIKPVLARMIPGATLLFAIVASVEFLLLRAPSSRREKRGAAAFTFVVAFACAAPIRDGTPEFKLFEATRLAWVPRDAEATEAAHVPLAPSTRKVLPNVLVILTESVRASDYCSEHVEKCDVAPEVNALVPDRVPLRELRSLASYTAVAVSALITGRTQEASRLDIARAPDIFDFVRAVRLGDARPHLAYLSAQSDSLFERNDVRSAVDSFVSIETLVGHAVDDEDSVVDRGVDRLLTARFLDELRTLPKPYFIVLHFAGTHAPYFVNEADAPFQPWQREASWAGLPRLRNAYKNAIHEQDKSIATCIRAFLAGQGSSPYVMTLTSDHGESFGERGAIHHGQNLYDEQIHVPGWLASGNGAVDAGEEAHLRSYSSEHVTHLDLLPTILDAYGVLDGFALRTERAKLKGRSWLRPVEKFAGPIPITNCTAMFPCPVNTWGLLSDTHALEAQSWDGDWNCVNLTTGEEHANDPACRTLRDGSAGFFSLLPNGRPNR